MKHFLAGLETKEKLLSVLQITFIVLALAAFFLPSLIAQYNGSLYYVRGVDMVMGREITGDKYGMVPQTSVALSGFILLLAGLSWLIKNKDKAAFTATLCSVVSAFLMVTIFFENDAKMARTDPIVAAMVEGWFQWGFFAVILLMTGAFLAGALRIAARPGMKTDLIRHKWIYFMAVPVVIYVLIFFYYPMYGTILAFKDYVPRLGILGSPWVGLENFKSFFSSTYFNRLLVNTLSISTATLVFDFVTPVVFALFLNEVTSNKFKRVVQTSTYLPHFISLVVICGLLSIFLQKEGLVNQLLIMLGMNPDSARNFLSEPRYFRAIYVISGVWQNFGWSSIIYFAAISNIDTELYEAASVDGAGRFRKMWSVTLPGIAPTVIVMLIMAIGGLMNLGHEKIILLYNPQTYQTADVIASYVYRRGIVENNYSFATAVGLFNTVINFILVLAANKISRRVSETSLW